VRRTIGPAATGPTVSPVKAAVVSPAQVTPTPAGPTAQPAPTTGADNVQGGNEAEVSAPRRPG